MSRVHSLFMMSQESTCHPNIATISENIVMWETRHRIADLVFPEMLVFGTNWKT